MLLVLIRSASAILILNIQTDMPEQAESIDPGQTLQNPVSDVHQSSFAIHSAIDRQIKEVRKKRLAEVLG